MPPFIEKLLEYDLAPGAGSNNGTVNPTLKEISWGHYRYGENRLNSWFEEVLFVQRYEKIVSAQKEGARAPSRHAK